MVNFQKVLIRCFTLLDNIRKNYFELEIFPALILIKKIFKTILQYFMIPLNFEDNKS
jgi:hypothetical protein